MAVIYKHTEHIKIGQRAGLQIAIWDTLTTLRAKAKEPFLPTHLKMTPFDRIILPILETLNFEYKTT